MFLEFLFFSFCTVDKFYGQPGSRRARIAELLDRIDDGEEPDNINYIEPPDNATEILTRRRHRLKGIHSRPDTNRTGSEGLSFYYPRLLHCLDQMLAVMLLSQHRV